MDVEALTTIRQSIFLAAVVPQKVPISPHVFILKSSSLPTDQVMRNENKGATGSAKCYGTNMINVTVSSCEFS